MASKDIFLSHSSVEVLLEKLLPRLIEFTQTRISTDLRAKFSASDVVQHTYLEACRDLQSKRFSESTQLFAWMFTLLQNNLRDFCRAFRNSKKRLISKERHMREHFTQDCSDRGILSLLIEAEAAKQVIESLELLPEHSKQLLAWRFVDGLPFGEIGRLTNRGEDAARMAVNRALDKLKKLLCVNDNFSA